tara:strand:+ start:2607 stop:3116 length:510 start_codon:yes stop_codon:yes gene_type:complete
MYVKITNGTPERYTLRALRKDNPNTSFPAEPTAALLAGWEVFPFASVEPPAHDSATQVVEHNGYAETGGTYTDVYVVRDKTADELAAALATARARMRCSSMQGILALGEAKWGEVQTYRETAAWSERMIIDSAQDWHRTSAKIQFIGYLIGFNDEQMDTMFITASEVTA